MGRLRNDLVGKKFGKLTVVKYAGKDKKSNSKWFCTCECGGTKTILGAQLLQGVGLHCGCLPILKEDLIGKKFGRLTVIDKIRNKNGSISWVCECSCAKNIIIVGTLRLLQGKRKSCGCLKNTNPRLEKFLVD